MKRKQFFLCIYGWTFWLPILLTGTLGMLTLGVIAKSADSTTAWILFWLVALLTFSALAFFRDFHRNSPPATASAMMLAPADGTVTEITRLDHFAPFDGPALRVGLFLSVLDVHVNRVPCDGVILATAYQPGLFLDARHPDSGRKNQSHMIVLGSLQASDHHPVAAVKQIVGAIARRIIAPVEIGDTFARGERFGMIAFGSRTELYVPHPDSWEPAVHTGQHVNAGITIMLRARS